MSWKDRSPIVQGPAPRPGGWKDRSPVGPPQAPPQSILDRTFEPVKQTFIRASRKMEQKIQKPLLSATEGLIKQYLTDPTKPLMERGFKAGFKDTRTPAEIAHSAMSTIPNIPGLPKTNIRIPEPHTAFAAAAGLPVRPRSAGPYDFRRGAPLPRLAAETNLLMLTDPTLLALEGVGRITNVPGVRQAITGIGRRASEFLRTKTPLGRTSFYMGVPGLKAPAREELLDATRRREVLENLGELKSEAVENLMKKDLTRGETLRVQQLLDPEARRAAITTTGDRPLEKLVSAESTVNPAVSTRASIYQRGREHLARALARLSPGRRSGAALRQAARTGEELRPTEEAGQLVSDAVEATGRTPRLRMTEREELVKRAAATRGIMTSTAKESEKLGLLRPGTVKEGLPPSLSEAEHRLQKKLAERMGRPASPQETTLIRTQAERNLKSFQDPNTYQPRSYDVYTEGVDPLVLHKRIENTRAQIAAMPGDEEVKAKLMRDLDRHAQELRDHFAAGAAESPLRGYAPGKANRQVFKRRADIPEVVRKGVYGQNQPAESFAAKVNQVQKSVAKYKFQEEIKNMPQLSKYMPEVAEVRANPAQYPGYTEITGTGWEGLKGRYLHPDLKAELTSIGSPEGFGTQLWKELLHTYKGMKTVTNPKTWFANEIGDSMFYDLYGFSIPDQFKYRARAVGHMNSGSKKFEEALQSGVIRSMSTLAGSELGSARKSTLSGLKGKIIDFSRRHISEMSFRIPSPTTRIRGTTKLVETAPGVREARPKTLAKLLEWRKVNLAKEYQNAENIRRMSAFDYFTDKGMSPAEAAKVVDDAVSNYSAISPATRGIRDVALGVPFATFAVKSFQNAVRQAPFAPAKLYKWYLAVNSLEDVAKRELKLSDRDVNLLKSNFRGPAVVLPMKDEKGNPMVMSIASFFPGWSTLGGEELSSMAGGPFKSLIEAFPGVNRNFFTGQEIRRPDVYETPTQQTAQHIYQGLTPSLAPPVMSPRAIKEAMLENKSLSVQSAIRRIMKDAEEGKYEPETYLRGGVGTQRVMDAAAERRTAPRTSQNIGDAIIEAVLGLGGRPVSLPKSRATAESRMNFEKSALVQSLNRRLGSGTGRKDVRYSARQHESAKRALNPAIRALIQRYRAGEK